MAHRSSASALHAAREVLRNYRVTVKPAGTPGVPNGLRADDAHLSIIIDKASNAHEVCKIREEIRFWQKRLTARNAKARDIDYFFVRLIEKLQLVPDYMPNDQHVQYLAMKPATGQYEVTEAVAGEEWRMVDITKAAVEAARYVLACYDLEPIEERLYADPDEEKILLARLLEVSMAIVLPVSQLPLIRKGLARLRKGDINELDLRKLLRDVGVAFDQVPHYEDLREETMLLV